MRWRLRGAWMWPAFLVLTAVDALIGHWLPGSGDTQGFGDALISAAFYNLIVVVALARAFGWLLRKRRRDLPKIVAADYAGTSLLVGVLGVFVLLGLVHRPTILQHRSMLRDAIARAEAFIGDRAPPEFRMHMGVTDTVTIEPGIYRTCVPGAGDGRTYCVVVKSALPFGRSVEFDGYESNRDFVAGMF
jgi:hypothetical protein